MIAKLFVRSKIHHYRFCKEIIDNFKRFPEQLEYILPYALLLHTQKKDYTQAMTLYTKILHLDSSHAGVQLGIGLLLLAEGSEDKESKANKKPISLENNNNKEIKVEKEKSEEEHKNEEKIVEGVSIIHSLPTSLTSSIHTTEVNEKKNDNR